MYLGKVGGVVLVLTTVPILVSILRVPFAAVAPMIVVSCAIQNAMFDIWLMRGFGLVARAGPWRPGFPVEGLVGYVFKRSRFHWHRSRWRWCSALRRGCVVPAVDDRLRRRHDGVLVERHGRLDQHAGYPAIVLPVIDKAFRSLRQVCGRLRRRSAKMSC